MKVVNQDIFRITDLKCTKIVFQLSISPESALQYSSKHNSHESQTQFE